MSRLRTSRTGHLRRRSPERNDTMRPLRKSSLAWEVLGSDSLTSLSVPTCLNTILGIQVFPVHRAKHVRSLRLGRVTPAAVSCPGRGLQQLCYQSWSGNMLRLDTDNDSQFCSC